MNQACELCGTTLFPEYTVSNPQPHVLRVDAPLHNPEGVVRVTIMIREGVHTEAFVSSTEHFDAFIHHARQAVAAELQKRNRS